MICLIFGKLIIKSETTLIFQESEKKSIMQQVLLTAPNKQDKQVFAVCHFSLRNLPHVLHSVLSFYICLLMIIFIYIYI